MSVKIVLLTPLSGVQLERLKRPFLAHAEVHVAATREDLAHAPLDEDTTLLAFGTGIIVPTELLTSLVRPAYNMHAASPEFPGRDPHHHAIYRGAKTYGATLHLMTAEVDAGPIVAVERFDVPERATPAALLSAANSAGLHLVEKLGIGLLAKDPLPALDGAAWGSVRTKRADLLRMCRLSPLIDRPEFERRYLAFDGAAFDNLTLELHDRLFRIDKRHVAQRNRTDDFDDFTEPAYRGLLRQLKAAQYHFVRFGQSIPDRHVLWRHDVDASMHRAAALAEIEAAEGVVATYFVNPRSSFYSLGEPEIAALVGKIATLGHDIGLHFDAGAYATTAWSAETLASAIERERKIVELLLDRTVRAMCWHNPDLSNLLAFDAEIIGGLVNAYSARLCRDYVYCSDSNGYWRFKPMERVIAEGHPRLHLLTHPDWWTPEALSPSQRIDRAIIGRARKVRFDYDEVLRRSGRQNKE
jgi:hypothetical protein